MEDLAKMKNEVLEYCKKRVNNGGKVANYNCPDCNSTLMTVIPNEKEDVWDSAVMCYECGDIHFAVKTVDGVTASSLKEQ